MDLKQELKKFIVGSYTSRTGVILENYIDLREAIGNPFILNAIADSVYSLMDKNITCVAGRGICGISIATAIASRNNLNLTLIRDYRKDHGTGKLIEGHIPISNDLTAIVDNVFTSGSSIREAITAFEETKSKIKGAYVVVKRGEGEISVPLHWLYTLDDLLSQ